MSSAEAPKMRVTEFTARRSNTLCGFGLLEQPSGQIIHDVAFHTRNGKAWAQPPSRPMLGPDGMQMRGPDGKLLWKPVVSFTSKEIRDRWSAAVVEALLASYQDALS